MRYTVTWDPHVECELTEIWLDASDKNAVADATNAIDRELAVDPDAKGEDFYGDRLLVVPPLCVTFRVYGKDNLVAVRQIWRLPPASP